MHIKSFRVSGDPRESHMIRHMIRHITRHMIRHMIRHMLRHMLRHMTRHNLRHMISHTTRHMTRHVIKLSTLRDAKTPELRRHDDWPPVFSCPTFDVAMATILPFAI